MSEFRIDQIKSQDASRGPDIAGITTFTGTSGIVMPSGPGIPDNILPGLRGSTFTAWQGLSSTRAAVTKHAAIAPDGTQTADEIANADNSENYKNIYSYQNFATDGTYIGEIFFKRVSSSTTPYVTMYIDAPADNESYVVFNLRDGIVETDYNNVTEHLDKSKNTQYLIEFVGNGWYRCAIMVKTISTTNRPFSFWPPNEDIDADSSYNVYYTGNTTNNKIYAWHPLLYRVEPNKNISEVISNIDLRIGKTTPGAIRFNTDSMKLEYYHGGPVGLGTLAAGEWVQLTTDSPEVQTGGARGVFGAGINPTSVQTTDYVNVASTGDAIDFGNLTQTGGAYRTGCASRTKGVFFNAQNSTGVDKIIIASTGSAASFGAAPNDYNQAASVSNSVKGFRVGGSDAGVTYDNIYQIIFESEGEYVDFGNLVGGRLTFSGVNSSTRGVFAGGRSSPGTPTATNNIDYFQMATAGNTADFGDLSQAVRGVLPSCNSVRGLFAGGTNPSPSIDTNAIEYITIATQGNSLDFGDLVATGNANDMCGNASSPTRGIFAGTPTNEIQYVQIMSLGDAVDFGNLSSGRSSVGACSNGHGGLG